MVTSTLRPLNTKVVVGEFDKDRRINIERARHIEYLCFAYFITFTFSSKGIPDKCRGTNSGPIYFCVCVRRLDTP